MKGKIQSKKRENKIIDGDGKRQHWRQYIDLIESLYQLTKSVKMLSKMDNTVLVNERYGVSNTPMTVFAPSVTEYLDLISESHSSLTKIKYGGKNQDI